MTQPATAAPPHTPHPGWRLRWAPAAARDGLAAFEHVEDDRANSHPDGQPHITVEDDHYRFTMHTVDHGGRRPERGQRGGPAAGLRNFGVRASENGRPARR